MLSQVKISPKSLAWTQDRIPVSSKLLSWDTDLVLSWLSLSKEIENGPSWDSIPWLLMIRPCVARSAAAMILITGLCGTNGKISSNWTISISRKDAKMHYISSCFSNVKGQWAVDMLAWCLMRTHNSTQYNNGWWITTEKQPGIQMPWQRGNNNVSFLHIPLIWQPITLVCVNQV